MLSNFNSQESRRFTDSRCWLVCRQPGTFKITCQSKYIFKLFIGLPSIVLLYDFCVPASITKLHKTASKLLLCYSLHRTKVNLWIMVLVRHLTKAHVQVKNPCSVKILQIQSLGRRCCSHWRRWRDAEVLAEFLGSRIDEKWIASISSYQGTPGSFD